MIYLNFLKRIKMLLVEAYTKLSSYRNISFVLIIFFPFDSELSDNSKIF